MSEETEDVVGSVWSPRAELLVSLAFYDAQRRIADDPHGYYPTHVPIGEGDSQHDWETRLETARRAAEAGEIDWTPDSYAARITDVGMRAARELAAEYEGTLERLDALLEAGESDE